MSTHHRSTAAQEVVPPTIKQIRSKALASLRDQARTHRERQHKEALDSLRKNQIVAGLRIDPRKVLADVILNSVRNTVTPVIASFGIEPILNLQTIPISLAGRWVSVETNYSNIALALHPNQLPMIDPSSDHVTDLLNVVKGLVYHEMGHLLFSVPLSQIIDRAKVENGDKNNDPVRPVLPGASAEDQQLLANWAYAVLDDQRMECALATQSPVIGRYLTANVETLILPQATTDIQRGGLWPFLYGRTYLPEDLRKILRQDALAFAAEKNLLSELRDIERTIDLFKRATTATEMWHLINTATAPLLAWFKGESTFNTLQYTTHKMAGRSSATDSADSDSANALLNSPQDSTEGRIRSTGQRNSPSSSASNGAASCSQEPGQCDPTEHLPDLDDELTSLDEVDNVLRNFNSSVDRNITRATDLRPMTSGEIRESEAVRVQMLDLVFPLLSHAEPSWQFRQDYGILDPISYRLREPGSTDFWSHLADQGHPGQDLAVSLILDVSASMADDLDDLFVAAIGVRKACEDLGFPCTLLTFASETHLVFDAHEPTKDIISLPLGSTNPNGAFEDLPNQRHGRAHHLVIAFTDGHWSQTPFLDQFRAQGTVIIGVTNVESCTRGMRNLGFDDVVYIKSTDRFAGTTASALVPFLA